MLKKIREYFKQKGQGVVEYALLLGFVALVTLALFTEDGLRDTIQDTLRAITSRFMQFNDEY